MKYCSSDICSIIVTYNPDIVVLEKLLQLLVKQVGHIIIVDNSTASKVLSFINRVNTDQVYIIQNDENVGLAAAHNKGILWATQHNFKFVLLFDQDSIPGVNLAKELLSATDNLATNGYQVAAVGPQYYDRSKSKVIPFTKYSGVKVKNLSGQEDIIKKYCAVDYVITSGSLIAVEVFEQVGLYDESLFIDYVDIEWALRAHSFGYQSFGVCTVTMEHQLGDSVVNFFGRHVSMHSPLRHYYMMRNPIYVYKKPYVAFGWLLNDALLLCARFVFYALFSTSRITHIRMMLKGLWDGLCNNMGKCRSA